MNKYRLPFLSALWLALALALFPALRAQEAPPAPATPAVKPAAPEAQPATPAVASDDKTVTATDKDDDDDETAEMDETEEKAQAAAEQDKLAVEKAKLAAEHVADKLQQAADKLDSATDKVGEKLDRKTRKLRALGVGLDVDSRVKQNIRKRVHTPRVDLGIASNGREIVVYNRDARVNKGETAETVVAIGGNAQVDGDSHDAVVTVLGSSEVNGRVGDAVVAVLGSTKVNGHVGQDVVAVLGNVMLGPDAVVEGNIVSIGGSVTRDSHAIVKGGIQEIAIMDRFPDLTGLKAWISKCAFWGRMLWFGPGLNWVWIVASAFLVFYTILALLFPRGIEKSAEVLEQRPGGTFLAMLLTVLLTPVLVVLLCITVVGIAVVPFLIIGLIFASLFGKASLLAWIGRRIIKPGTEGALGHPAVAVVIGGFIVMFLYTIPILGMLLFKFFELLGLAMVVYRLILSMQREKSKVAPVAAAPMGAISAAIPVAGTATNVDGSAFTPTETATAAAPIAPPPVIISAVTLPRAGFWRRIAATLLDLVLVGMVFGMLEGMFRWFHFGGSFPFWFAVYNVVMWTTKSTTIGGIVCGLKIVRLDDRPLDWSVSIIRGLTAFLSLAIAGLGFIWVAFDDEKQSWHDKIAGTTIVRVPKGTPLL